MFNELFQVYRPQYSKLRSIWPTHGLKNCMKRSTSFHALNFGLFQASLQHELTCPMFVLMSLNFEKSGLPTFPTKQWHTWKELSEYFSQRRQVCFCTFGFKQGSMDKDDFTKYLFINIVPLYYDAANVPGKQVLIKIYTGPGLNNIEEMCPRLCNLGFSVYPSVKNTTSLNFVKAYKRPHRILHRHLFACFTFWRKVVIYFLLNLQWRRLFKMCKNVLTVQVCHACLHHFFSFTLCCDIF